MILPACPTLLVPRDSRGRAGASGNLSSYKGSVGRASRPWEPGHGRRDGNAKQDEKVVEQHKWAE